MSHYKSNTANRDALFGGGGGGGGGSAGARNNAANRDALFGGAAGGGGGKSGAAGRGGGGAGGAGKPAASRPRPAAPPPSASASASASAGPPSRASSGASSSSSGAGAAGGGDFTSTRARLKQGSGGYTSVLSGVAKIEKMKEAEEYRTKAKKAMSRGILSKPDPIAASMFYKRAADAYKLCGENRLERLHRIASGDCQMGQDAFATAAAEYTRAAELSACSDEPDARKRQECHKLHSDAASAWRQMGENGRAGESMMNAAFSLLIGLELEEGVQMAEKPKLMAMDKKALAAIEVAVETHTPDPLNRYRSFRQTGKSAYIDPAKKGDPDAEAETMELAKENLIRTSYAHETVFKAVFKLIKYGEYPSALYAAGAASRILEADDFATISLSRAFCTETIICLALGDVIAADKYFMEVHLQRSSYLKSRECKLAEDLIRAVKSMDAEALEEARSPAGSNRAALANLDPGLRGLVMRVQTSGRARREGAGGGRPRAAGPPPGRAPAGGPGGRGRGPPGRGAPGRGGRGAPAPAAKGPPPGAGAAPPTAARKDDELHGEALQKSLEANFAELDDLMGDMGLESDEEGDGGGVARVDDEEANQEIAEEEEEDDDFIDLR